LSSVAAAIQSAVNAIPSTVQAAIDALTPAIQPAIDAFAFIVQTPVDPIALAFQMIGQSVVAVFAGPFGPAIHAPLRAVTAAV